MGVLAYIQDGNIWVKALPGGQAKRLTTDGRNCCPSRSPSGQWLAFSKYASKDSPLSWPNQKWVIRADGTSARALYGGALAAVAWAPTVDRLAYATSGELWTVNADGTDPALLVTQPSHNGADNIAWSLDEAWVAWAWLTDSKGGLWKIPAKGGVPVLLLSVEPVGNEEGDRIPGYPILSGWAGSYLLFWQGEFISVSLLNDGVPLYALHSSGGEPLKLSERMLLHADFLASSPGGKLLAITEGFGRETWTEKGIVVVDLSSGKRTLLTDDKTAAFSPAWSPDGQRIAYVAGPDIGSVGGDEEAKARAAQRRIWVVNRDSSDRRQLTDDAAYRDERPLWSADGSHILFARLDQSGRASLWLMRNDGSELNQVVDELTPAPDWFGYYGYIEWHRYFDWWAGTAPTAPPITGSEWSVSLLLFVVGAVALLAGLALIVWRYKSVLSPPAG
jgi:dipeptidyl aminopeptidase/acylaminoacyl peptidase